MTIEVHWTVEDGYVNNGPHSTTIDVEFELGLSEEEWNELPEEEQRDRIEDLVQEDFEQKISYGITRIETR